MVIVLVNIIFVSIKQPYASRYNNIRLICNLVIVLAIGGIFMFYSLASVEEVHKDIGIQLPIAICVLLLVCVLYGTVCIIYEIVKKIRRMKSKSEEEKYKLEEESEFRQLCRMSLN